MSLPPAVIVHSLDQARSALAAGLPVTLLSAPGAASYAGCAWWRALVRQARAGGPALMVADILDCGDASGQALAALRIGQQRLVLAASAPGRDAVAAAATVQGARLYLRPPPALDLATRGAACRLHDWLQLRTTPGDTGPALS